MKKIIAIILFTFCAIVTQAQQGVLIHRFYYSGSMSLGKENRDFCDSSAWLEIGQDTTERGVLLPRAILDSISKTAVGLFAYNLIDSTLYSFDGLDWIRYMTLKDTALLKAMVEGHSNDLTNIKTGNSVDLSITNGSGTTFSVADEDSSSTNEIQVLSRNGDTLFISDGNYVIIPVTDTSSLSDRIDLNADSVTYLGLNYFKNGGNTWGVPGVIGTNDNNYFAIEANSVEALRIFPATRNACIGCTVDAGYKLNVNGTINLNGGLFFQVNNAVIKTATNFGNIDIGQTYTIPSAFGNIIMGGGHTFGSLTTGQLNVVIGAINSLSGITSGTNLIVIGRGNSLSGNFNNANVMGSGLITGSESTTNIGEGTSITNSRGAVSLGNYNVINNSVLAIARGVQVVGNSDTIMHGSCGGIGNGQKTTNTNQFFIAHQYGTVGDGYNDIYFSTGIQRVASMAAFMNTVTLFGGGAANVSNSPGGDFRTCGGKGTGTGTGGDNILATTAAEASGTTRQSAVDRVTVKYNTGHVILHYVAEYTDNAAAVSGGLAVGTIYRTGDDLKIVH